MTANEPPNPYSAPNAALADGAADESAQPRRRHPSRLPALAVAFFGSPLLGAGLYLLGRPRRFRAWAIAGGLLLATMIVAIRLPLPRLAVFVIGPILLAVLLALLDTAIARPGEVRLIGKPWVLALAFILAGQGSARAIRQWLVEAFQMPSGSMVPTLLVGDHIFVKKGRSSVARGDVIVFEFPADRSTDYLKRVVAVGGDVIEVRDGVPSINGVPLAHEPIAQPCSFRDESAPSAEAEPEPCTLLRETNAGRSYTIMRTTDHPAADFPRMVIREGEVFVLGDNRDNSYDSRRWGTVPVDHIKGTATVTWWSKVPNGAIRWSRVGLRVE